ncbi:MAG: hypothetical protein V5A84_00295 [Planctomycetota bacterium]
MRSRLSAVLKANDIRGVYPDDLDAPMAYAIGRAIPRCLDASRVAVARDARLSSPELYAALIRGIEDAGGTTGRLGMCPTEFLYYALGCMDEFDLGVMVTASHNPPRYNGFKLCGASATPLGQQALRELLNGVHLDEGADIEPGDPPEQTVRAGEPYLDYALRLVDLPGDVADMEVVVDPGNGVAGVMWELITGKTGLDPLKINFEPDGSFPAHLPDTSKNENLEALRECVVDGGARLGLAYDGDSDRVAVVTGEGDIMQAEEAAVAVGSRVLESEGDGRMALSMAASRSVLDALREQGRPPVLVPVGHSKVKKAMRRRSELTFAAESSGHFYYRRFCCCDSTLLTTLHLLALARDGVLEKTLRDLRRGWHRPESQPSFYYADPDEAREACLRVAREMVERYPDWKEIACETDGSIRRRRSPGDIAASDGVRVDYADWWFCVRPSGTEPKARLMLESRNPGMLQQKLSELQQLFSDGS